MRKTLPLLILLFTFSSLISFAQIPNPGFENWTNYGTFMEANGWTSTNLLSSGNFYPITRSTDHYPASVGSYSIRIANDTAVLPSFHALGFTWTLPLTATEPKPSFPVSGHPNSFTGYYKFIPQKNDTMHIEAQLYLNGVWAAYAKMTSTATASNWTSFSIPFTTYTSADSGVIILGAYNVEGITSVPHGNSVLYIDNLNFDNLITSVDALGLQDKVSLYPNPVSDNITIAIDEPGSNNIAIKICDVYGKEMYKNQFSDAVFTIDVSGFAAGTYFVLASADDRIIHSQKVIIIK